MATIEKPYKKQMGFFDKLKQGLSKTKQSFNDKVNNVFSAFRKVDEELLEELEEALIMSDVGVETSTKIINNLRDKIKKQNIKEAEEVKQALREEIQEIFDSIDNSLHLEYIVFISSYSLSVIFSSDTDCFIKVYE